MDSIAQLDIAGFSGAGDPLVEEFWQAYQQWGFAGITGHGISNRTIRRAFDAAQAFFALSEAQKLSYTSTTGWARGYVPFGTEKARDASHVDLKEFYHIGREHSQLPGLGDNIWPIQVSEFKSSMLALYRELDQLAATLLEIFALGLQLPQDYFSAPVSSGEALLRVLHYPPINDPEAPNVRAAAHEDINLITLLVGSEQAGLEVLSRQGEWVPISMIDGTIICNVGDMLQRLSNARLPSTTHRVVNPDGANAGLSRYSMPFFVHPAPEFSLASLSGCVDTDHPARFDPVSAGEYHAQRIAEIGLKQS